MGLVMSILKNLIGGLAAAGVMIGAASAATVTLAGETFDESRLADSAFLGTGTFDSFDLANGTVPSINDAFTDGDLNTGGRCDFAGNPGCSFAVVFDGGIANQAGDDLRIFGIGVGTPGSELFDVIINGSRINNLQLSATGETLAGFAVSALSLDLEDFGIAFGDVIDSISIIVNSNTNPEEFAEFVSLNESLATPIPAAFLIFLGGAAGLFGASRKKQKA